ncbi:aldehyde reductase [Mesorhizobium sp. J428]|uniref:SDR family oxidoreductase n=1 Tax=Mesorhizobium sp. J428 TaxID=2898440 RepID=UPI002151196D|nr:aldehyde reductase [Mesorhizobium sp. J428]MCR5859466.1 aldehyde reductase [Mesorhizobium sp. J428]
MSGLVLVTGGSGFIGAHCIVRLIAAGYRVRTTVRSLAREADVREMLKEGGCEAGDRLSFAEADLMRDAGWLEAAAGCDYVLHVASPLPVAQPNDADELVRPARDGALRVLRAARDAGVKRVVMTSSFAAIGYGNTPSGGVYTEKDWTDTDKPIGAYVKSKALAERAAWDFLAREGNGLELATVNPVVVLGPVLGRDYSASVVLIETLLKGGAPAVPKLMFGVVDVRDVADLHLLAMTRPEAKGERFLAVAGDFLSVREIALALKAGMGPAAAKVPTWVAPNWVIRLGALFSPTLRTVAGPELGREKNASAAKARQMLGWSPRSPQEAIVATGESLVRLGLVKA